MKVYAKGVVGEAWQFNGDVASMPDWVKSSSNHRVEVRKNLIIRYSNGSKPVDKGDWFVRVYGDNMLLYSDDAFKMSFTFSDPALCPEDTPKEDTPNKGYQTKPMPVEAWQYSGSIELTKLPSWVVDLILHRNFGYREVDNIPEGCIYGHVTAMQYFDGVMWLVVSEGDWLVRYDEHTINVVPDEKFKELFEEIK